MKVALVHDWLVSYRGGEKVLEVMSELYPQAPIYTLFYDQASMPQSFRNKDIRCPPGAKRWGRWRKVLLPWLPAMIESLPLWDYDLILSSSSCVAKGALAGPYGKHLCYIHSPMRYVWDQQQEYLQTLGRLPLAKTAIALASPSLRLWDSGSAQRVDRFIANSSFVAQRVKKYYGRDSQVIYPPIDTEAFHPGEAAVVRKKSYFLAAGAFVPYKRFDLAIAACEQLGKKLIVAGSGPGEKALRSLAGPHTEFRIAPGAEEWRRLLQEAEGLIFPGVEDFGMIAVEAMASGTPVLAFNQGGARDFILPGVSGAFFETQTQQSLAEALANFQACEYAASALIAHGQLFNKENFRGKLQAEIAALIGE